jgi:tRNA/rRNA methyltransferase
MTPTFILVEPSVPENVGFAARAIKTMGFADLWLVAPCDYLSKPARKTAYGSHDVLENARVFENFELLANEIDFLIATTAKIRDGHHDCLPPDRLPEILVAKRNTINSVGLVFGREDRGLSNQELSRCDLISTVPLARDYPSLNLGHAVMVYAYELANGNPKSNRPLENTHQSREWLEAKKATEQLLQWLDINDKKSLKNRIFDRLALANSTDIHLLLSVWKSLKHKKDQFPDQ